jgi:hypothetical protein
LFSRTESLESEDEEMRELSRKLAAISRSEDKAIMDEARQIITKLRQMNQRWNLKGLDEFIKNRQRELFF